MDYTLAQFLALPISPEAKVLGVHLIRTQKVSTIHEGKAALALDPDEWHRAAQGLAHADIAHMKGGEAVELHGGSPWALALTERSQAFVPGAKVGARIASTDAPPEKKDQPVSKSASFQVPKGDQGKPEGAEKKPFKKEK